MLMNGEDRILTATMQEDLLNLWNEDVVPNFSGQLLGCMPISRLGFRFDSAPGPGAS